VVTVNNSFLIFLIQLNWAYVWIVLPTEVCGSLPEWSLIALLSLG
jgi:hypothetical protein